MKDFLLILKPKIYQSCGNTRRFYNFSKKQNMQHARCNDKQVYWNFEESIERSFYDLERMIHLQCFSQDDVTMAYKRLRCGNHKSNTYWREKVLKRQSYG